jgi:hypothetical protein
MMKHLLKPILPVAIAFTAFNTDAQITIDQSDFPASQGQHRTTFYNEMNEGNYATPSEGPNQIWDYQGLIQAGLANFDWSPSTDQFFSDGYHYEAGFVSLSGFTIKTDFYMGYDSFGYYRYGQEQYDTTFSIAAVTGGANDQVHFVSEKQLYNNVADDVIFPMTYGDQWTSDYFRTTPFEITVAGFGLSNTPGQHKRSIIIEHEVVGYGKLLMSHPTSSISDSMDVLLLKNDVTQIDSFFVGGMPAPPALLAGLNLTQGSVTNKHHTSFYRLGYGDLLMEFIADSPTPGSTPESMYFNENGILASTVGLEENILSDILLYPNPAQAGQEVKINLSETVVDLSEVKVFSLSGKEVIGVDFTSISSQEITLNLPVKLKSGKYLVQGKSTNGTALFTETLVITQ